MEMHGGILWKIDVHEMNRLLPGRYQESLRGEKTNLFTVEMLNELACDLDSYDADMGDR